MSSGNNVEKQLSLSTHHGCKDDVAIHHKELPQKQHFSQADNFCLKTKIFEAIEELKMRRELHAEAEEKVQQLLQANLNLQKIVDAEKKLNLIQTDKLNMQLNDIKKKFNDNMLSVKEDKEKHVQLAETAEKEVLKLRDEIRNMLLNKYSLEKRVQELERAIDFQDSSRHDHHSQLVDLEQKCKQINLQRTAMEEMFEQFKKNVESACEFNRKLEYISEHRQCQIDELHLKVDQQHGDLLEVKARLESRPSPGTELSKMKSQEDTFHKELQAKDKLCDQLLKHVEEIRNDHKKTMSSLSDAHSLIDHYVKSKEVSDVQEVKYQHLVNDHEVLKDSWQEKNKLCLSLQQSLQDKEKQCLLKEEELSGTVSTYRNKCDDLTKSSDKLQEIREHYSRMYKESELSRQALQESITKSNSLSKGMTSQATQTHCDLDELVTSNDITKVKEEQQNSMNKESTNINDRYETDSGVIPVENVCLDDIPSLMDRIQSASPDLVSYYITVNQGNDDAHLDNETGKSNIKKNINVSNDDNLVLSEEDKFTHDDTVSQSTMGTKDKLFTADVSLPVITESRTSVNVGPVICEMSTSTEQHQIDTHNKTLSPEMSPECLISKDDDKVFTIDTVPELGNCGLSDTLKGDAVVPHTSGNNHRSISDISKEVHLIPNNTTTTLSSGINLLPEFGRYALPDTLKGDTVVPHTSESNRRSISDSKRVQSKPHDASATLSSVSVRHQGNLLVFASRQRKQQIVVDANIFLDTTIKQKCPSNLPAGIQTVGNFRPMGGNQASMLKTDLVASCHSARTDLDLISQQWEEEKRSQKMSQDNQRLPFQTAKSDLNQISEQREEKRSHKMSQDGQQLSFQTARSDLNQISEQKEENPSLEVSQDSQRVPLQTSKLKRTSSSHPVDFPLEQKKARLQTRDGSGSNLKTGSTSPVFTSKLTHQVTGQYSPTPLFSDDEEEELSNRKDIADQIARITSLPYDK